MNITIKGTNLGLTEPIKSYVDKKISALAEYGGEIIEARVELEMSTHHQKGDIFRCEVNLDVPQKLVLRAECTETDMYAAIDCVVPKLRDQINSFKGKQQSKDRRLRRYMKSMFAWRPWGKNK